MILIGAIGAMLILLAWIFEAEESVRRHKSLIDLRFAFIYLLANIFLIIYCIQMKDMLFLTLQIGLLIIVSFEILYTTSIKKIRRKKR